MPPPSPGALSSWIELSERAYDQNVRAFRAVAGPQSGLGAVLKGNAYGHGFPEVLSLAHGRVDALYLITPGEGLAVRAFEAARGLPKKPVLVIGAVTAEESVELSRAGVAAVIGDRTLEAAAPLLRKAGLSLEAHLHLDTGLGREGFTAAALARGEADFLLAAKDVLRVTGVLSHFANTEDVTEQDYALRQLEQFDKGFALLLQRGLAPATAVRHFAASAAALVLPASRFNLLRVGIGLYGLWPSTETRLSARVVLGSVPALEPVLSWRAPSQLVKWVPAGSYIGYGCTWRCSADTRVAILPVGYWDGVPRLVSGKAHVLINGQRCAVLGRIMMNHLVADVTHAAADERPVVATLIGRDGDESISAETFAGWAQTIHYEIVTGLGAHLARKIV
jgi:alanine racemase